MQRYIFFGSVLLPLGDSDGSVPSSAVSSTHLSLKTNAGDTGGQQRATVPIPRRLIVWTM